MFKFTVVNPETQEENILEITNQEDSFLVNGLLIDKQQLAELGSLFIALAGNEIDSIFDLLDGYGLQPSKIQNLSETCFW